MTASTTQPALSMYSALGAEDFHAAINSRLNSVGDHPDESNTMDMCYHVMPCKCQLVTTFKAYITEAMVRLTYALHKIM